MGIEFCIKKCATLKMKSGKRESTEGEEVIFLEKRTCRLVVFVVELDCAAGICDGLIFNILF